MKKPEIVQIPDELACRQPLVLFDGECNLCNSSVRFLIRHNHSGNLSFTSLQSDSGKKIVSLSENSSEQTDTLILLQENTIYSYSTAALKIAAHLRFPWNLPVIFIIIPARLRDAVYRFVAQNRYQWFGSKAFCSSTEKKHERHFLE
jgi:predicted DCC family thiol-disulfide oxidoreductase YuxK